MNKMDKMRMEKWVEYLWQRKTEEFQGKYAQTWDSSTCSDRDANSIPQRWKGECSRTARPQSHLTKANDEGN